MSEPLCPLCNKWAKNEGSEVCVVCRTLERLVAIIRSPSYPPDAGQELLRRLRGWAAEAQDVGEVVKGVVPASSTAAQGGAVRHQLPGIAKKSKAEEPPARLSPEEVKSCLEEKKTPLKPEEKGEKKKKKKRVSSSSPSRHRRKKAKKSRSRSRKSIPRRQVESPKKLLDVKKEEDEPSAEEELVRTEVPASSRPSSAVARSPSRSPPRNREKKYRPSEKPAHWEGPIRALKRQPAPGQGKHNGKYKGKGKELRNDPYWRRKRAEGYYW